MKKVIFIRFLLASIAAALGLGVLTLLALRALSENMNIEFRRHLLFSLESAFENGPIEGGAERYEAAHPGGKFFRPRFWVVSGEGQILTSNNRNELPEVWAGLSRPEGIHEVALSYRLLGLTPSLTVMRLATETPGNPTYLVVSTPQESRAYQRDFLQIFLFGSALAFSAVISMLITFFYLRHKSKEAREVLLRLERGDLKARFQIKHFDEMGSLMLDFNRMASEIERLVGRLQETEQARQTLFQELSHDLRTPLTGLRASIETLAFHWREMKTPQRDEILNVCRAEVSYFTELLESLLFIAQIDEPKYRKTNDEVDLVDIIASEISVREKSDAKIRWNFSPVGFGKARVPGDSHLLRRLIRNALENAGRFAKTAVRVELLVDGPELLLKIQDDGPGMTREAIDEFGQPRTRRVVSIQDLSHVSLGLGSVIMKKILDLHQGKLQIKTSQDGSSTKGTSIEMRFVRNGVYDLERTG